MNEPSPRTRLICAITSATPAAMAADIARALAAGGDCVECRLDYLAETPSPADLRALVSAAKDSDGQIIMTYRPVRQGGRYDGKEAARLALLAEAARAGADYIDVEDDVPPADRPEGPTILSHHDFDSLPKDLDAIVSAMESAPAAVNKIACTVDAPEQALTVLDVVRQCRKPTIACAMGEAGQLSRVLAPKVGAFGTFGSLSDAAASAPGQVTVEQLRSLYRWDAIKPATACFGVIGCPVGHSMSPAIHNAAFDAAGIDGLYAGLLIQPGEGHFRAFLDAVRDRPWLAWRGLSVTIPHKENALAYVGADRCDELAVRIGAVNTITFEPDGSLRGDNTDYAAAIDALCDAMDIPRQGLADRTVAVLGAGGAARAIVAALAHYGAKTTIYNRTVSRGQALADEFGCTAAGRDEIDSLDAEIIINCTPLGMHPKVEDCPMDRIPATAEVVFDTIYNPPRTRLLALAEAAGCVTVDGVAMFVRQAVAQFERWTGVSAPVDVMRHVVLDRLRR